MAIQSTKPTVESHNPVINEDDLDMNFFTDNNATLKNMKLNKGEKRVLKFILQRELGKGIDINAFLKN